MSYLISPSLAILPPVAAPDTATAIRWTDQRARREILDGTWRQQLIDRAIRVVGTSRITGWGDPSLARNLAESVCRELAVLYDEPLRFTHDTESAGQYITDTTRIAGLQAIMQRVQAYTIGVGSCYVRVRGAEVVGSLPRISYEVVPPDEVYDVARTDGSGQPALVRHYVPRSIDDVSGWTADEWDLRDPDAPAYRLIRIPSAGGAEEVLDAKTGASYPYRRADGRPVMPYILYNDGPPRVGLHDPNHREALFAGTLDVAVFYWMATHGYRDASWPQRAVAGMRPIGGESSVDSDGNTTIRHVMDPAVLAMFERLSDDTGQPMQWQWGPGADVEMMFRVNDDLAARVAVEAGGVSPADLHRAAPNRSGSAIALTNEGKRRMQAKFTPSFRPSDERLAAVTATIVRSLGGPELPESAYRVIYGSTPLSVDEQDARRRHAIEAMGAGLMSRLEAYLYIHPELTVPDAERAIEAMTPPRPVASADPADLPNPTGRQGAGT
jgi:hypothetical protein